MYSILHISDLHRSSEDPISNEELISSLTLDRARYTCAEVSIRAPDAIIISGDIIQGVTLGCGDSKGELRKQYEVAEDFLVQLAAVFVEGDRSRIIIAPGNHDVDWNIAKDAMEAVAPAEAPHPSKAFSVGGEYRWSWKDRCFFRITNAELYEQRLDAYWDFIERFYNGVKGIPVIARDQPFGLFKLWEGRIGVAVFNSCRGNDCYAFHGAIDPNAIALAQQVMTRDHRFELWLAVWHHSIQGAPYRTDYMDVEQVHNMVGYGFRLGLHGHQHKHQVMPVHVNLPDRETMAVVSAGSLCAGSRELPTGYFRQYNIIEINEDILSARIHVRQMETASLFSGCHMTIAGGKTYIDVRWSSAVNYLPSSPAESEAPPYIIFEAERLNGTGSSEAAAEKLLEWMPEMKGYGRTVFVQACVKAEKWDWIINKIGMLQNIEELVAFVESCDRVRKLQEGKGAIDLYGNQFKMPEWQQVDLKRRLQIRAEGRV